MISKRIENLNISYEYTDLNINRKKLIESAFNALNDSE